MSRITREFTSKFLEGMDEGTIDPKVLAQNLLGYMSERDVEEFAHREGYFEHEEETDDEGPDPGFLWNDTSAELT
jgi:hypothetical protein